MMGGKKQPWRDYRQVIKLGNSLVMSLPSSFVKAYGIKAGQVLTMLVCESLQILPPHRTESEKETPDV